MAGCNDGKLTDPQSWFFDHIHRALGQPAMDYKAVLSASGILGGPPAGVLPGPANFGITQQMGGGGIKGRLFLPTTQPDSNGYFTKYVDLFDGDEASGTLVWAWKPESANTYAPRACGSAPVPSPVDPPAPSEPTDLVAVIEKLNEILALLKRPAPSYSGTAKAMGYSANVELTPKG